MEDTLSKNIILILLILLVLGLLGVLYLSAQDYTVSDTATTTGDEATVPEETPSDENAAPPSATGSAAPTETKSTPAPAPVVTTIPQSDASDISLDQSMVIVTYTDSGFIPPVVEVRAGNSVTFINSSGKPMWITSEVLPGSETEFYPGFGQGKSVPKGGTYTFNFTQVGTWGYKNLNFEKHVGTISVVPQQ